MKNCENIRESLGAWLDSELSQADSEAVRSHLADCSECNAERRQLEKLQRSLKSVLDLESSPIAFEPFWRGVRARINEKRPWHEDVLEWLRSPFAAPRLAWAVPAAIALILGVLSLDSFFPGLRSREQRNNFATVVSIDSYGWNVALLREDETKTTVIWLFHNPEGENESTGETGEASPAF
jgi:anti-sigma factor RsiW